MTDSAQTASVSHKTRVHIRWMIRRDMPEALVIEQASFAHGWSEEKFLKELRNRSVIGMVAEAGPAIGPYFPIAGYMVYRLEKDNLHVMKFATHPDYRRSGVGAQMIDKLVGKLSPHRRTTITLNVRETNLAAQRFYASQGFKAKGVEREYYYDTGEDAYRMVYTIGEGVIS